MPKRRPVFEFKGLSGFLGSSSSDSSYRNRSGHTDESPRRPSLSVSSRYQSPRRHHRRTKHKRRGKHHKHRHSHRAHYAADQYYHRSRYDNREDSELAGRSIRSPLSDALQRPSPRSPIRPGNGPLRSPPPLDPIIGTPYRSSPIEYPQPPQQGPEPGANDRVEGAADPRMEHRRHRRHRRRGHKRRSRRRRRKKRDDDDSEDADDGSRGEDSDSEEAQHDEDGNPVESATNGERSKSGSKKKKKGSGKDGKKKKGKKRNYAKVAALALGALVVGLIAKKIIARKRRKKAEQEAQVVAAQQEATGPYGGSGGELFSESNPLQLPVPKSSFSVKAPEAEAFIVERGGRYNRRLKPGSNILIPFVDRIAFRFSLKEVSMAVPGQQCYTHENVSVMVSALLFAKVEDAVAAAYGVDDAHRSLMLLAQTCMRKEVARLGIEHMLQDREGLGDQILRDINRASRPWGVRCTRFEIRDLEVPEEIRMALERQAQVERQARADVLASQGAGEAMRNRADAEMHVQMRMSQARQIEVTNQAIGEAHAISERGEAIAGAMRDVAEVVREPGGEKAMRMRIVEQYIHQYVNVAKNQDHLPPPPDPTEMEAAISNVLGLVDGSGHQGSTVANPHVQSGANMSRPTQMLEQQQEHYPMSGDVTQPPIAISSFSGPSPRSSSHQPPESHHSTPQVQAGIPPIATSTHDLPQDASTYRHPVPSSRGSSKIPDDILQAESPMMLHAQLSPGEYAGPSYPQAQPLPNA